VVHAASRKTGTAFQKKSTFLFVPSSAGTNKRTADDDTNAPGAYFRLGSYSDIEAAAPDKTTFYPRKHIEDATTDGQDAGKLSLVGTPTGGVDGLNQAERDAMVQAAVNEAVLSQADGGGTKDAGIMFACNGRVLLRSAERIYVHSRGKIHFDTESTFDIKAGDAVKIISDDTINMTSGYQKNITIEAPGGDDIEGGVVSIRGGKEERQFNGESYEWIKKDSFKYYECNLYTYKLGGQVNVTLGGKFSFWMGVSLTINLSLDLAIKIAPFMTLYSYKFDIGLGKTDILIWKTEIKAGKLETSNVTIKATGAKIEQKIADVDTNAVKTETGATRVRAQTVDIGSIALSADTGGPEARIRSLSAII